jgi:hypothetical protein
MASAKKIAPAPARAAEKQPAQAKSQALELSIASVPAVTVSSAAPLSLNNDDLKALTLRLQKEISMKIEGEWLLKFGAEKAKFEAESQVKVAAEVDKAAVEWRARVDLEATRCTEAEKNASEAEARAAEIAATSAKHIAANQDLRVIFRVVSMKPGIGLRFLKKKILKAWEVNNKHVV